MWLILTSNRIKKNIRGERRGGGKEYNQKKNEKKKEGDSVKEEKATEGGEWSSDQAFKRKSSASGPSRCVCKKARIVCAPLEDSIISTPGASGSLTEAMNTHILHALQEDLSLDIRLTDCKIKWNRANPGSKTNFEFVKRLLPTCRPYFLMVPKTSSAIGF